MSLCMMMRSCRSEPPDLSVCVIKNTDDIIGKGLYKTRLFLRNIELDYKHNDSIYIIYLCTVRYVQGTIMLGKLFQRCNHFLYCSVLSLGGKVNTRQMLQPDMEFIFTKIIYEIFWSEETIM